MIRTGEMLQSRRCFTSGLRRSDPEYSSRRSVVLTPRARLKPPSEIPEYCKRGVSLETNEKKRIKNLNSTGISGLSCLE